MGDFDPTFPLLVLTLFIVTVGFGVIVRGKEGANAVARGWVWAFRQFLAAVFNTMAYVMRQFGLGGARVFRALGRRVRP